jgi:hypothetical protein
MIQKKPIVNKFYKYAGNIVKIKKISKAKNKIYLENLIDKETITIPYEQSEILIVRLYTVGEVAKIVERRPDTLRKYERRNLIPSAEKFGDEYTGYSNWRYYDEGAVYEMVEFFNQRVQGRPILSKKNTVENKIQLLSEKVKLHK